jgi:hypothetical protein
MKYIVNKWTALFCGIIAWIFTILGAYLSFGNYSTIYEFINDIVTVDKALSFFVRLLVGTSYALTAIGVMCGLYSSWRENKYAKITPLAGIIVCISYLLFSCIWQLSIIDDTGLGYLYS